MAEEGTNEEGTELEEVDGRENDGEEETNIDEGTYSSTITYLNIFYVSFLKTRKTHFE